MQNPLLSRILQAFNEQNNIYEADNSTDNDDDVVEISKSTFQNTSSTITPNMESFLNQQFYERPFIAPKYDLADLECLEGTQWINDAVLNSYLSICFNSIDEYDERKIGLTNSFFMKTIERDGNYQAASFWQGIKGQPINKYDLFFIPICSGYHWILAVIDFISNEIQIYDSLHGQYSSIVKTLNGFLRFQGLDTLHSYYPMVPTQRNGYDCGVFVMEFGRCLLLGDDINSFSQRDIPEARKRIYAQLYSYLQK